MSWDKIIKQHQSAKLTVISKSESKDFVGEILKLEQLDNGVKDLYKFTKQMNEAVVGAVKSEQKMVADLCSCPALQSDADDIKVHLYDWLQDVRQQEELVNELTVSRQKVVMEPLKKLSAVFPVLQAAIKKREQCLQEYQKWHLKVEKYQKKDRTGANVVKLATYKKNLAAAKEEFEAQNALLVNEMPKLYDNRVQYFAPSLQSLISLQLSHYGKCFKMYTELQHNLDPDTVDKEPRSSLQERLSEIRSLSIVVSD